MYMDVFPAHMSVYHLGFWCPKMAFGFSTLQLEFKKVMSHHVDTRNQTLGEQTVLLITEPFILSLLITLKIDTWKLSFLCNYGETFFLIRYYNGYMSVV